MRKLTKCLFYICFTEYRFQEVLNMWIEQAMQKLSDSESYSRNELPFFFENALKSYQADRHKIIRYAGRRGKLDKVMGYIGGVS